MQRVSSAVHRQRKPRDTLPFKIVAVQSAVGMAAALVALLAIDQQAAFSAFSGALVSVIPCFYFAWQFSRVYSARASQGSVGTLYRAAAGKFGLTVALFAVVFALVPPSNPASFFCAYVATSLAHWLAPWLLRGLVSRRI